MDDLDTREWLLTNGLGSFASGTVCDARTRTYHGWLMVALDPPGQRTLLLSHLDASLEVAEQVWALGTNFWSDGTIAPLGYQLLRSFELEPVPTWVWSQDNWRLTRQLVMPYGLTEKQEGRGAEGNRGRGEVSMLPTLLCNRILIQYRYEGSESAILRLRPLIGDRNFHHQQFVEPKLQFSQLVGFRQVGLQAIRPDWVGTPWYLRWSEGDYQPEGVWYWGYRYLEETRRGLSDREDLYSPGYLTVMLQPGESLTLEAKVGWPDGSAEAFSALNFEQALQAEAQRLAQLSVLPQDRESNRNSPRLPPSEASPPLLLRQLLRAGDQFIAYRSSIDEPAIIAGYPWFSDRVRDTLIALPGLAISTGRFSLTKSLLQTLGRHCKGGLIPHAFPDDGTEPFYNSIDASLWWIETLGLYLETTQDWEFLAQQYAVVRQIYKAFCTGTLYNIHVDVTDGLLTWDAPGVALTWMDAVIDGRPITPRRGKPVEVNALWYSALCWTQQWAEQLAKETTDTYTSVQTRNFASLQNQARRYAQQAEQVKASLKQFWNPERGYFYDTIEPDGRPNPQIRPNAVLALSLYHCGFPAYQAQRVLQVARDRLLTPYGLRSLDPAAPSYVGRYAGDPVERDNTYHQGTVWSWLIGAFIRAWKRFYSSEPVPFDWQPLLEHFQQQACLGSVSEIFDGDLPHTPQGAFAQAWSVAEIVRHLTNDSRFSIQNLKSKL